MNTSMGTWLLGGALLASMGWNAAVLRRPPASAPACGTSSCAAAAAKLGDLGLSDAQRQELTALLRECDEQSARGEARAAELSRELRALLRDANAGEASIRARAQELAALRAGAIERCIDSSLKLRRLLEPAQVGRLLDVCCGDGCCGE